MEELLEEEMMEVGEEGSCLERKNPYHFSAQTEKWIKEEKVLPLREWVKQEFPVGLNKLNCNRVTSETREELYVIFKGRKISYELIGREPNEFIIIHSTTLKEDKGIFPVTFPGDMTFKLWLNPRNSEFQLIEEKVLMEKIKDGMCCNLF